LGTNDTSESRFEAAEVRRISATKRTGRLELQFSDANDKQLTVTLSPEAAIELGRLICDLAEGTPFLKGKPTADERKSKP
jgi:hypothetical protein